MEGSGGENRYEPELGQAFFGAPTGRFDCPEWAAAMVLYLLDEIGRVHWNRAQKEWDRDVDPAIDGIEFRPYYWGDADDEAASLPNLKHGGVEVRWYKYPGRGMSLNVAPTPSALIDWFDSALSCIRAADLPFLRPIPPD